MNSLQTTRATETQLELKRLTITATYFAAFIILGLTNASLGPLLPSLADQTLVRLSQVSILFTARALGYLLGSFLGGRIYDRRDGHPVIAVALILVAICMAVTPAIPLLWGLALIMVLLGGAEGSTDVGGNTLLIWLHGKRVPPYMNGLHFFFGLGALLSPLLIAWAILISNRYSWALWLVALLIIPIVINLLRLPSPISPHREIQDVKADQMVHSEISTKYRRKVIFLFVLFFMTAIGAEMSFGGWIYTFAVQTGLATIQSAAYLTSAFWAAFTISRLGSIYLANSLTTRAYLITSLVGCTLSLSLLNTLRFLGTGSTAQAVLWLGAALFGFSIATVFPNTMSFAGERTQISGQVTSLFFIGLSLSGMFLPWMIGQFFESAGPYSVMVIIFLVMLLSLVFFVLVDRISSRKMVG